MFDSVVCEYPLPDPRFQKIEFQTKDLERGLSEYRITPDGRLVRVGDLFGGRLARPRARAIHGDITIYGSVEGKRGKPRWVDYRVRFTRGRVEWIRPERRRSRSSRRGTRVEPRWPDRERGPLVPGIEGRRLTADEPPGTLPRSWSWSTVAFRATSSF